MTIVMDFEEGAKTANTLFHDLVYMSAVFTSPTSKLRSLLPLDKLQPVEWSGGVTRVTIAAFEYKKWGRDQPLPPYNEWAFMIPVKYVSGKEPGLEGDYVVWMPVTHEMPMRGGIEGWGFNKFMSEITFTETRDVRTCNVVADGKNIVRFKVRRLGVSNGQNDLYCFNKMKDSLTWTLVQFKGDFGRSEEGGSAGYELGDHPIAKQLGSLGLGKASVETTYGVNVRANLHSYSKLLEL